uniref:WH2 domain-containing protein n=1 Tax=Meloidogyne hapla TaxID=6305 RepID=A0A1I8BHE7_MELHA
MAFVGHPILADIRKGIKLKPTKTIDKSKPFFKAEGENMPSFSNVIRGPSSSNNKNDENNSACLPPPPPPPPVMPNIKVPPANNNSSKNGFPAKNGFPLNPSPAPKTGEDHRKKLLAEICHGVALRHVDTVDKGAPAIELDENERQQLLRATTPNDSLDSQGKSPSPSLTTTTISSSNSSSSPSQYLPPNINGQQSRSPSPLINSQQPKKQWKWAEVKTEAEKREEAITHGRQNSDYQFDDQKQIEERQKEVAALSGIGSAQSKIAAFRQLQASSPSSAYCTLPRISKNGIGAKWGQKQQTEQQKNGKMNGTNTNNGTTKTTKNNNNLISNGISKINGQQPNKQPQKITPQNLKKQIQQQTKINENNISKICLNKTSSLAEKWQKQQENQKPPNVNKPSFIQCQTLQRSNRYSNSTSSPPFQNGQQKNFAFVSKSRQTIHQHPPPPEFPTIVPVSATFIKTYSPRENINKNNNNEYNKYFQKIRDRFIPNENNNLIITNNIQSTSNNLNKSIIKINEKQQKTINNNNLFPSSSFKEEQQKQINFNEEEKEEENGVNNFWKTSTIQRKQQKFNKFFGQKVFFLN